MPRIISMLPKDRPNALQLCMQPDGTRNVAGAVDQVHLALDAIHIGPHSGAQHVGQYLLYHMTAGSVPTLQGPAWLLYTRMYIPDQLNAAANRRLASWRFMASASTAWHPLARTL